MPLTTSEESWLAANHPKLVVFRRANKTVIEGRLLFHRSFKGVPIRDDYSIRLEIPDKGSKPILRETNGRIRAVFDSRPHLKYASDIHAFENWSLCYAAPQELTLKYLKEPDLQKLITKYIEPYLYSQSYFEKYDRWPWPHLPHNTKGVVEWFLDNHALPGAAKETAVEIRKLAEKGHEYAQGLLERSRRHDAFVPTSRCLCGSNRGYLKCHRHLYKLVMPLRKIV